jgi:hypothetical protein
MGPYLEGLVPEFLKDGYKRKLVMRNLVEYPIDSREVLDALDEALNLVVEKHEGQLGSINGMIMVAVYEAACRHPEFIETVCKLLEKKK